MTYTDKSGKVKNIYYGGGKKFQEDMESRGWSVRIANSYQENEQDLYDRLAKYYDKVRIYYDTTMIRGYHKIFAFVK